MNNSTTITTRFGPLHPDASKQLRCLSPILGFEDLRQFILLDVPDYRPFLWLQSLEEPGLAFVLTEPRYFGLHYDLAECARQQKLAVEQLRLLVMVILPENASESIRAHKLGPLWFDATQRSFGQWVIDAGQISGGVLASASGQDQESGGTAELPCMVLTPAGGAS
ncbi:MAG: flagellar assembly protein FliW [Pseudomonadota bacterium]